MATIWMHIPSLEKRKQIEEICKKNGWNSGLLSGKDLNCPLYQLVKFPFFGKEKEHKSLPPFYGMPELLLFAGLGDSELDHFLAAYKESGLKPVSLKAVVTPYNAGWSLYELILELQKEAAGFLKNS